MGKEKGRMHLLLQRTSLLLVYLTFIIWLLLSFWVWGVFTITQKGWSKCNILIKWNFHFQVVVQFLQFHQQSGKRSLGFFEHQHLKNMGSLLFCCLPQIFKHTWGHMQAPRLLHTRQHLEIKLNGQMSYSLARQSGLHVSSCCLVVFVTHLVHPTSRKG